MNAYSPHISETRRRLLNEAEEARDTRDPYDRLNALACAVIDTSLACSIYRGNDEHELGFLEKRAEDAEAQFISEIEEYGNPDLLAGALSHCNWTSVSRRAAS